MLVSASYSISKHKGKTPAKSIISKHDDKPAATSCNRKQHGNSNTSHKDNALGYLAQNGASLVCTICLDVIIDTTDENDGQDSVFFW